MARSVEVALVNMPFSPILTPSLGLGLLKSSLRPIDVSAKVLYFNLRFAKRIGETLYSKVADDFPPTDLLGEWIFSESLFEHQATRSTASYIDRILRPVSQNSNSALKAVRTLTDGFIGDLLSVRAEVGGFLKECLEIVLKLGPKIVGFTTIFEQHVSSLSLARLIKQERPDTFVVFGGSNCESVMGYEMVRQFDFIDAVVSGEGDIVFRELTQRVLAGQPITGIQGVFCRTQPGLRVLNEPLKNTPIIGNLDQLPIPDYDDYFEQLDSIGVTLPRKPVLLFETSRGCWWGEKHHCTFCGLNGETMIHRSKSARRALDELSHLTTSYPGHNINVVDNILDMGYFKDFIPALAESKLGVQLFYEVKSNLRKDQLRLLHNAGITSIQPGIESLSDEVLQIMRKGVKAIQNIQLLKWCKELGIKVYWNLIMGFPGEPPEAYQRMTELIPLLTHLEPPTGSSIIRIDRFSPNFEMADELGFTNLHPYPAYSFVYPFPPEVMNNSAYFFTFEYKDHPDVADYTKPVAEAVGCWIKSHENSSLFWVQTGNLMMVWDSRPISTKSLFLLKGLEKFIYEACDQIKTLEQILAMWKLRSDERTYLSDIKEVADKLVAQKIMIEQNGRYLSLAIPRSIDAKTATAPNDLFKS